MPQFPDPVEPPVVYPKADLKLKKEDLELIEQMPGDVSLVMPGVTTPAERDAVFADALSKVKQSTKDKLVMTWDGSTCKISKKP